LFAYIAGYYSYIIFMHAPDTIMTNNNFIIGISFSAVTLMTCIMFGHTASAQDTTDQKIPIQIIEEEIPGHTQKHVMALGVNLDPFPTIISAVSRNFGLAVQPWFGIDHFKVRFDVAHMRVPDTIAGTRYFHKNNCNSFALVAGFMFGNNFDGFVIGAGMGIWQHAISHKHFNVRRSSTTPFFKIEGGYIWKFHKNLYLEPCIALDIILGQKTISIYGFMYKPLPVAGEITVKFGIYVDLDTF
jgi:hypothetical protein